MYTLLFEVEQVTQSFLVQVQVVTPPEVDVVPPVGQVVMPVQVTVEPAKVPEKEAAVSGVPAQVLENLAATVLQSAKV